MVILAAILMQIFVFKIVTVPTSSMSPTIRPGEWVLVNRLAYRSSSPRRGDIVIFENPEYRAIPPHTGNPLIKAWRANFTPADRLLVKRVIGLPGEVIQVTDNQVLINARPLHQPWLTSTVEGKAFGPYRIPANAYFVMGDNRLHSIDSRFFPEHAIRRSLVVGKAITVLWPPGQIHRVG